MPSLGPVRPGPSKHEVLPRLVDAGWSVLYFPEGRRSETGALLEFKSGIGTLAVQTGRPVVPVRIKGTEDVMPMGARYPRRGVIEVTFGEPLRLQPRHPLRGSHAVHPRWHHRLVGGERVLVLGP